MPVVTFVREDKKIEIQSGKTIIKAARDAAIYMETPCNGEGSCGKCKVKITLDEETKGQDEDSVLACQTKVYQDVKVYTTVSEKQNKSLKILTEGTQKEVEIKTAYYKKYQDGKTIVYNETGQVGIEDGDTTNVVYGLTIDIGTTTLVCALINCLTGEEIVSVSEMNPQCVYAQDVVSRINYCSMSENGLETLYQCIVDVFNRMIDKICIDSGVDRQYIYEAVYSGNTTMIHLATNTDPYALGQYPYIAKLKGGCTIDRDKSGLKISSYGRVYLPPIISSYVGADITSGVLASNLLDLQGTTLFIDIGTNGEMIMAADGKLTATSTAAGPAFEGMNITFGMRAGDGAIEGFEINERNEIIVKTIGNTVPKGICGSGLFDITGELVRVGVIEKSGKLIKPEKCNLSDKIKKHLKMYKGKIAFEAAPGVYLTLMDIRQIQLAKSAIRAGIEAMIALNNMTLQEVDRVYIAGSFGYHLRRTSLVNMGIIPEELEDKISFVGNTSKTGGNAFLLNTDCRRYMEKQVQQIRALELSEYPNFEKIFVQYMRF